MIILGLTGSIAMGKSTTARLFRRCGVPVHDADAAVRRLQGPGGRAVPAIGALVPAAVTAAGGLDRGVLGRMAFADPGLLQALESLLHPMVRAEETRFLAACARARRPMVVLDVPLLYETGAQRRCDAVAVVTAPACLQRQRALARPDMTEEKLSRILARQMPDAAKRRRAEFVVHSGLGVAHALQQVREILTVVRPAARPAWRPGRLTTLADPDGEPRDA